MSGRQWRSSDYVIYSWTHPSRETLTAVRELMYAAMCVDAGVELPRRTKRKTAKGMYVSQNPRLPITEYEPARRGARRDEAP